MVPVHTACWGSVNFRGFHGTIFPKVCSSRWARVIHSNWMVPGLQQVAELIGILVVVKFRPVKLHGCREIVVQTLSAELVGIRCVVQPRLRCWACKGPWNSEFVLQTRAAELVGIRRVVQPWLLFWWFYGAVAATAPYFQKCAVPVGSAQRVCWGSVNSGGFAAPWQPRHQFSKSGQFLLGSPGFVGAVLTLFVVLRHCGSNARRSNTVNFGGFAVPRLDDAADSKEFRDCVCAPQKRGWPTQWIPMSSTARI